MNQSSDDFEKQRETIHRNMLSSVSHDLKTPLASVIGSLEIYERMKDKLSDDKKEALIGTALQEAYRLDNFVTNILEMAKLENGTVKVQPEPCNLAHLLRDCTIKLGHRLKDVAVTLETPEEGLIIQTDPAMLTRAVLQVLDNAVKYGGTPAAIDIKCRMDLNAVLREQTCVITIQDNGKGVPEGHEEVVFEKYTRFSKQDQQAAGTGLGLSICRNIMRLLGGTVSVTNTPSSGACFVLSLPHK